MKSLRLLILATLIAFIAGGCGPTPIASTQAPDPTTAPVETTEPAQAPVTETVPSTASPALLENLHWLGHASFRLDGPPTIYFDPTNSKDEWPRADIILISHGHDDHFSLSTVERLSTPETIIITSAGVAKRLEDRDDLQAEVRALQPGERTTVGEVDIEAVPAYNIEKSHHPKESGNLGFVVSLQGERLYFAGDTERIPEMADIECDVALLPIDGKYTMDAEEAALAAADIRPKVAIPMHMFAADPEQFRSLCDCEVVIMEEEM